MREEKVWEGKKERRKASEWMACADLSECRERECSSIPRLSNSVYARWEYPAGVLVRQEFPCGFRWGGSRPLRTSACYPHISLCFILARERLETKRNVLDNQHKPLQPWALHRPEPSFSVRVTGRDTQTGPVRKSYLRTWKSQASVKPLHSRNA